MIGAPNPPNGAAHSRHRGLLGNRLNSARFRRSFGSP
jgi:hypothetical protein